MRVRRVKPAEREITLHDIRLGDIADRLSTMPYKLNDEVWIPAAQVAVRLASKAKEDEKLSTLLTFSQWVYPGKSELIEQRYRVKLTEPPQDAFDPRWWSLVEVLNELKEQRAQTPEEARDAFVVAFFAYNGHHYSA